MAAEVGLFLDGLRCAGCVNRTERALREARGVVEAHVNYTSHRALVQFDASATTAEGLVETVRSLGYDATPYDPAALERPDERAARGALIRLLVAAFLAMNVMWIAVALYTGAYQGMDAEARRALRWVAIVLSAPAVFFCAWPFWRGAFLGLARGELTIDVPVVLGVGTSFVVSIVGTLAESEHLYMDSAAVIVFLILLGRTLEQRARARAASAVERLATLTPDIARRIGPAGVEEVEPRQLRAGDRVIVPAGETIPVDARVITGRSDIDESTFTGESVPVVRSGGDGVTGGTSNLTGELIVEVTAPLDAGRLARLADLLERAQAERPEVQRMADRVAAVFAPTVLAVAAATAVIWVVRGASGLEVALTTASVLIVACPCALGLATPAAITAAIGRAASLGVLVKSGASLERCASVDAVLLDKTGTLSEGRHRVEAVLPARGTDEAAVLRAAALAEGASTHPLAEAIRDEVGARGLAAAPTGDGQLRPGLGVVWGEGAEAIRVGSERWLVAEGVRLPQELVAEAKPLAERGLSLAWVARGFDALGVIACWDRPRPDARQTVARLSQQGCRVALVTGDHPGAAARAASATGITDVVSEASPEDKVGHVRRWRAAGQRVLVAGDGVNDAAALAAADVGVAMARGSDVTLHTADIVVRAPRLGALADTLALSRRTLARIRENLGFALVYNAVAVPLAIVGWLDPLLAAIAMSGSSVVVTLNALRLLRFRAGS